MAIIMTLWIGNGAVLKSYSQWQLKLNNSVHELQELLRTAPLPIHKVIINAIF